jgi:RecB family exonuclease
MDCSALSPSRIKTTKDCEFKYFLQYHLRLPEAKASNIYGHKGSAAHEALEFYGNYLRIKANPKLKEELKAKSSKNYTQVLKNYYAKEEVWKLDDRPEFDSKGKRKGWPHPVEKNCEACPWATKGGRCSIAKIPYKKVEGCPKPNFEDDLALVEWTITEDREFDIFNYGEIIGCEVKFFMEREDGSIIRGVIDLVIKVDDHTLEIVDFKSGNSMLSYDKSLTDPQMRIYSMVAKELWPEYETYVTSLFYIRKRKMVSCVFSETNDVGTQKSVGQHWNKIRNNTNPYRPQRPFWLCNFCVGHDACEQIQKNHTKNGRFVLPVVQCGYTSTEEDPCWGGLAAENPDDVTIYNTDKMTHACCGHINLHKGGEYEREPDGGEAF